MFESKQEQELVDNLFYIPKADQEVLEDICNGNLPREFQEQMNLVEQVPEKITQKIQEIIIRILLANKLDGNEYNINIQISHKDYENAGIITQAKMPLLFVTSGLLKNVRSEDELAGVIAHEIGHLILYYADKKANHHNKIEESLADALGVKLLATAGYDPNAMKDFLMHAGDEDIHLITLDNLIDQGSIQDSINLVSRLTDPHPAQPIRIRTIETVFTSLDRNADIPSFKGQPTQLSSEFYVLVEQISSKSPLQLVIEGLAYETRTECEKLGILTTLLQKCNSVCNNTQSSRMKELSTYIRALRIDFTDAAQTEAFKCLADVVMAPQNIAINFSVIGKDLQELWANGGKNPAYFARIEDFKEQMELFTDTNDEKIAEQAANAIIKIANTIYLYGFFYEYYPIRSLQVPDEVTIRDHLTRSDKWIPPYSKHLKWYQTSKSENIKKVLLAMELYHDPWVSQQLDGISTPAFNWLKWHQIKSGWKKFSHSDPTVNYTFFRYCIRNTEGEITGIVPQIANYEWEHTDRYASEEEIIAHQTIEATKKRQYDNAVIKDIDWTLLRTDFPIFMYQYGLLLEHNPLLKYEHFPFAQQFYARLDMELFGADDAFFLQVKDFFTNSKIPKQPFTVYRYEDIYRIRDWREGRSWPYQTVERPRYTDISDPFIQFILKHKALLTNGEKLSILATISGFKENDWNAKLADKFKIPLSTVLNEYPEPYQDISSFKQACDAYLLKKLLFQEENIIYLIEAERLAYAHQDTMSLADFVSLHEVSEWLNSLSLFSNYAAFMSQLRVKVIKACISSNDIDCLIRDYRIICAYNLFYEPANLKVDYLYKIQALINPLNPELKLRYLRDLFKPELIKKSIIKHFSTCFDRHYDGYLLADFRSWAVEEYTTALTKKMGQDNSSQVFFESAKKIVDELILNTTGITQVQIISGLADKINAQKELAYYMRDKCKQVSLKSALANTCNGILLEYFLHESSADVSLRELSITFLTNPLDEQCTKPLVEHIMSKNSRLGLKGLLGFDPNRAKLYLDTPLRNYHRDFRASTLEMKTTFLEPLLFPLTSSENKQKAIINKLVNQIFPKNDIDQNDTAQILITAYLNAAKIEERRLLATAIFVANMQEEGAQALTVGLKLYTILSNIGPAGAKLLQSIHSHPQTPQDIKNDLAKSKTEFSKPKRWEFIELVDKSGLLQKGDTNPNPIKVVGPIIGSGSFGVTSFNILEDGSSFADTFLRVNAAAQATREFKMMQVAAQEIVTNKPSLHPIVNMIDEANRLASEETDFYKAEAANHLAENAYEHYKLIQVGVYQFTNQVAKFNARGTQFKRVAIAHGSHFNDLPKSSYKEAAAKAVLITQLSLRLSGINTDLDRHGGNIRIEGNVINHFDFGAMNTKPISQDDKRITGKVLAQAIYATRANNEDFTKALLNAIQIARVSSETREYLNGLTKDFLALGDYTNSISSDDLVLVMAFCFSAKTVDPQIKDTFKEELGYLSPFINLSLLWKTARSDIKILTDTSNKHQGTTQIQLSNNSTNYQMGFFINNEKSKNNNSTDVFQTNQWLRGIS